MNTPAANDDVMRFEYFTWMKPVVAKNDGKRYLMMGTMINMNHTLLVTLEHGNGGAVMYCQLHGFVYPIKGKCAACQNAPREVQLDECVTARNTT